MATEFLGSVTLGTKVYKWIKPPKRAVPTSNHHTDILEFSLRIYRV